MPALLVLVLMLLQLACGASTLRKLWLQHDCSIPSFWPTILQIMLPEVFTSKLACPWLEQSSSPGLQAWHSACAGLNALAHAAAAAAQVHRCQPHALCVHRSIHALQHWHISSWWPRARGASRLLAAG